MACQATPGHLFAAPFAMVGSIGVLMEMVNFNEVLKRYGVKPLIIKAGANKAPLKTFGEVTQEELKMAQDDADVIHLRSSDGWLGPVQTWSCRRNGQRRCARGPSFWDRRPVSLGWWTGCSPRTSTSPTGSRRGTGCC